MFAISSTYRARSEKIFRNPTSSNFDSIKTILKVAELTKLLHLFLNSIRKSVVLHQFCFISLDKRTFLAVRNIDNDSNVVIL